MIQPLDSVLPLQPFLSTFPRTYAIALGGFEPPNKPLLLECSDTGTSLSLDLNLDYLSIVYII